MQEGEGREEGGRREREGGRKGGGGEGGQEGKKVTLHSFQTSVHITSECLLLDIQQHYWYVQILP